MVLSVISGNGIGRCIFFHEQGLGPALVRVALAASADIFLLGIIGQIGVSEEAVLPGLLILVLMLGLVVSSTTLLGLLELAVRERWRRHVRGQI